MEVDEDNHEILNLEANRELRFTIKDADSVISIELVCGSGEIFGIDMIQNKIYDFTSSFAVTTRAGCSLKLRGKISRPYIVNVNNTIYNLHRSLEEHRNEAESNGVKGPMVLIAGPTDVGKSTLSRSLLNYAARSGRKPLYVDLDVGQSSISIPGTIGILPIDGPGDIVKGFNEGNSSVYFFGYKSPGINLLLYFLLINKLGETLHHRLRSSQSTLCSGAVIDTCGWVTGGGYRSILLAAESFKINLLFVLSDKNLHANLRKDLPNIDVQFIPKLSGVVERSKSIRCSRRDALVQEYFYGTQDEIKPYTFNIKFSDVQIFRVSSFTAKVTNRMLEDAHKHISLLPVSISVNILNHILALSYADTPEAVMLTSVLGFICVIGVDMENQIIKVISPQPGPLPKNIMLIGDLEYNPKRKS